MLDKQVDELRVRTVQLLADLVSLLDDRMTSKRFLRLSIMRIGGLEMGR